MTCQVSSGCFICAQHPIVYAACVVQSSVVGSWRKLPGISRWALVDNVTEGDEVLTSDTEGKLVKACPDTVAWSMEIDAFLCDLNCSKWIYNTVLAGNATNMADPECLAYWATWKDGIVPTYAGPVAAMETHMVNGIAVVGGISPRGFEVDGSAPSTPVSTQLVVNVITGPFLPNVNNWADSCANPCDGESEPYEHVYPGVWPDDWDAPTYGTSPPNAPASPTAGDKYQVAFQDGNVVIWNFDDPAWSTDSVTDGTTQNWFGAAA